jgi:hypothetical protein
LRIEAKWTECITRRDCLALRFGNSSDLFATTSRLTGLQGPICTEVGAWDQARGKPIKIGSSGESVGRFRALTHQKAPSLRGFERFEACSKSDEAFGWRIEQGGSRQYPQPVHTFLSAARGMCVGPPESRRLLMHLDMRRTPRVRAFFISSSQDQDRSACFIRRCEAVEAISRDGCVAPDAHSIPLGNLVVVGHALTCRDLAGNLATANPPQKLS